MARRERVEGRDGRNVRLRNDGRTPVVEVKRAPESRHWSSCVSFIFIPLGIPHSNPWSDMQPPRITLEFSLILSLSVLTVGSQQGSDVRTGNVENNSVTNEAMERNKRLVPYVTYCVTQSRSEPRYEAAIDAATTTKSGVRNSERLRPSIFYPRFTESSSTRTGVYSSDEGRPLSFHEAAGSVRKLNDVTVTIPPQFALSSQNARLALPQLIRIVPTISQPQPRSRNDTGRQSTGMDLRMYDSRLDPGTDRPNRPRPVAQAANDFPAANTRVNHELGAHTSFGSGGVNPLDKTTGKLGTGISSLSKSEHNKETKMERLPRLRVPQESEIRFVVNLTPIAAAGHSATALKAPGAAKVHSTTENYFGRPTPDGFLSVLSETSKLPKNLTPQNIDNGIKVLALILERLQKEKEGERTRPAQPQLASVRSRDEESDFGKFKKFQTFPLESGTSTPGRPGIDYPTHSSIPQTSFDCSTQRYKGFFGDPETECQVWHYCDLNGGQASFLCPNGTIFSQAALTCDWWFNVKCASTSQLYVLNERLYKYILPFSPSFPEDYSGPIVDRYLTAKFNEMERKSKIKAMKPSSSTKNPTTITTTIISTTNMPPKNESTINDRQ